MKGLSFFTLVLLPLTLFAKEVAVTCSGEEKQIFWDSPATYQPKSYDITFDDSKKKITSMTVGLIQSCFPESYFQSIKCDCSVGEKEVKCDGEFIGINNPSVKANQTFVLNRLSGRLRFTKTISGQENEGKSWGSVLSGDFSCEPLRNRKF